MRFKAGESLVETGVLLALGHAAVHVQDDGVKLLSGRPVHMGGQGGNQLFGWQQLRVGEILCNIKNKDVYFFQVLGDELFASLGDLPLPHALEHSVILLVGKLAEGGRHLGYQASSLLVIAAALQALRLL